MSFEADTAFKHFSDLVCEGIASEWSTESDNKKTRLLWPVKFTECHTDYERVLVLLETCKVSEYSLPSGVTPTSAKCDLRAQYYRQVGNIAWKGGNCNKALLAYTKGLMYAHSDFEKALAYSNRSCVLARFSAHSAVVDDVTSAIKLGYPPNRLTRLYLRRGQSLVALGRFEEADDEVERAQHSIPNPNTSPFSNVLLDLADTLIHRRRLGEDDVAFLRDKPLTCMSELADTMDADNVQGRGCAHGVTHPGRHDEDWDEQQELQASLETRRPPAVKLQYGGPSSGWELVASRDILPGDLLLIDRPYTRRLHYSKRLLHCFTCFRRCLNLQPCRRCSQVGFCSPLCEEEAWQPAWPLPTTTGPDAAPGSSTGSRPCHRFECGQVERITLNDYGGWRRLCHQSGQNLSDKVKAFRRRLLAGGREQQQRNIGGPIVAWLAFACLARTDPDVVRRLAQGRTRQCDGPIDPKVAADTSWLAAFNGTRFCPDMLRTDLDDRYEAADWLTTNSEKRTPHDLWQRTVAAVFLTHCLGQGGYPIHWPGTTFVQSGSRRPLPAAYAAACLLRLLQVISSNAHSVNMQCLDFASGCPPTGFELETSRSIEVASCLYPSLSLVNHSCDPNVAIVSLAGCVARMHAIQPIAKGTALLGNYGAHYAIAQPIGFGDTDQSPAVSRRKALADQYHFDCHCRACREDWRPMSTSSRLFCKACAGHCDVSDPESVKQTWCKCQPSRGSNLFSTFYRIVNGELRKACHSIPLEMKTRMFRYLAEEVDPLDRNMLTLFLDNPVVEKNIDFAVKYLSPDGLESFLGRPAYPYDWLQELLKLLMDIKYGCWFSRTEGVQEEVYEPDIEWTGPPQ